jgi:hypothetical protein
MLQLIECIQADQLHVPHVRLRLSFGTETEISISIILFTYQNVTPQCFL